MTTFAVLHSGHPCTELTLDVGQVRAYMETAGHRQVDDPAEAEVLFVATCAFNVEYEEDAVERIGFAKRAARPGARVIAVGCLPPIHPERFAALGVEGLPPRDLARLETLFPSAVPFAAVECHAVGPEAYERNDHFRAGIRLKALCERFGRLLPLRPPRFLDTVPMPDWHFVRAASGCAGACSYCAIKRSRGDVRSVAPERVEEAVRAGVARGARTIALAGDDLGCWGADLGLALPDLLDRLVAVPGDFRLHLRFVEPLFLIRHLARLTPAFQSGKVHSFCVPLQSGAQRILDRMNRRYRIDEACAAISFVMEQTRVSSVSSIVMVGFPGETAEDFAKSYALIDRLPVPLYQALRYEGRPGTPSEAMAEKVPEPVKDARQARFRMKMRLRRFLGLPSAVAERIVTRRLGPLA